jgi:hypothetical protein
MGGHGCAQSGLWCVCTDLIVPQQSGHRQSAPWKECSIVAIHSMPGGAGWAPQQRVAFLAGAVRVGTVRTVAAAATTAPIAVITVAATAVK